MLFQSALKLLKRYEATLHHICNSLINSMKEDQFVDQSGTIESKSTKSIKQEESDLDRVFEDMKDESNPTQTPITGKRFDILVHSANKLLDPNYASWITSKKALHFTFVSTTQNPKSAISRLERIGIKKNAYIIYKNLRIDDADIISWVHRATESCHHG